jgi:thioesterase domain-containing protein
LHAKRNRAVTPAELERYLHTRIPLSRAMEVSVAAISEQSVTLAAPLAPNINHRHTVFGGSAAALATLAAWSLLQLRLLRLPTAFRLVVQRNTMDYLAPISCDFTASSSLPEPQAWERQLRMLARKGTARFLVAAEVHAASAVAGRFSGEFVALAAETR